MHNDSVSTYEMQRPASSNGLMRPNSSPEDNLMVKLNQHRSKLFIKEMRRKEQEKEEELIAVVEKGRRLIQYDALQKIAEANEWCEQLELPQSFRVHKLIGPRGEDVLEVHVYEGSLRTKRISLNIFVTHEYPRLRARFNTIRGSKRRQHDARPKSSNRSGSTAELDPNSSAAAKKRQEELQQALLTTVQLTNKLKEQLAVLDRNAPAFTPYIIE